MRAFSESVRQDAWIGGGVGKSLIAGKGGAFPGRSKVFVAVLNCLTPFLIASRSQIA